MSNIDFIAEALFRVRSQTALNGAQIINTEQVSRYERELLLATGWLQEIIRGWYMLVRPDTATGDTAAWYANFWDFMRVYLTHRFGNDYCLSAESSMELHTANPTIPAQVIVIVKKGAGLQKLMYGTSILLYSDNNNYPQEIEKKQEINIMSLPYALCKVSPNYFQNYSCNAELALRAIDTPASLSRTIIKNNFKTAAARIIGAYQFLQDQQTADSIKQDLILAGILVTPTNPFVRAIPLLSNLTNNQVKSPYAGRIFAMWAAVRATVKNNFPAPLGLPINPVKYLQKVNDIYEYDAYNSLSIEGYQVNDELITRVKSNLWNPTQHADDANMRNALAAKGYYDTFNLVKQNIEQILNGASASVLVKNNLQKWYQKLFYPSVQAGIITAEDLIGYRSDRVFIRNSRHSPPPKEALLDAMEAFFMCLEQEEHAGVRAILGHYFFVFIHPYMDGNGRLGRFIMNTLLAAGGYPWTVVTVQNRKKYIDSLETAHTTGDLTDFVKFISLEMSREVTAL